MKKILSVILAVLITMTIILTSCGEKIIENHPDAIAAEEELQGELKTIEDYSDGMIKTYAAAKGTGVIVTFLVNDEDYEYDENTEDGDSPVEYGFNVNDFIYAL